MNSVTHTVKHQTAYFMQKIPTVKPTMVNYQGLF